MVRYFLFIIFFLSSFLEVNAQLGIITKVIGTPGTHSESGLDGPASAASICNVTMKIAEDGTTYLTERFCGYIRKITPTDTFTSFAGNGTTISSGDGGPASSAGFNNPYAMAFDSQGDLYVGEIEGCRVRKIDMHTGIIQTYAGTGRMSDSGDGGPATRAGIALALYLAFDKHDNLYILTGGHQVKKIDKLTGILTTLAGIYLYPGSDGDGGPATAAHIRSNGMWIDSNDKIYLGDLTTIRVIDPITHIISRYAGTGSFVYNGEGLPDSLANINPNQLAVDSKGNMFMGFNSGAYNRIRYIRASDRRVYTLAGNGIQGYTGDGGPADTAEIGFMSDMTIDGCDNIYFDDDTHSAVRKVSVAQTGPLSANITPSSSVEWLCYGMPINFYCSTGNTHYRGSYHWTVNHVAVGGDSATLRYAPANGDTIQCTVGHRYACDTTTPAVSNIIVMAVSSMPAPVITLPTATTTASVGDTVRLTATVTGTAGAYEIHWRNRGNWFATTTAPSVSYIKAAGNDTITATLVSLARTCYDSVTSNNKYIDSPVSIPEVTNYNIGAINCYPNPVSKNLTIESEQYWNQLEVSDALGKIVYSTHLETPSKSHSLTTNNWAPGVYFVKIDRYRVIRVVKE